MARANNVQEEGYRKYTVQINNKTGFYEVGALGLVEVSEPTLEELEFIKMVVERQIASGNYPEQRLETRMKNPRHKEFL